MKPFFICHTNEQLLKYEEPDKWVFPVWTDEQLAISFRNQQSPNQTISNFSREYVGRLLKQQSATDDLVELNPTNLGNGTHMLLTEWLNEQST